MHVMCAKGGIFASEDSRFSFVSYSYKAVNLLLLLIIM